jgi:hypothetical protein
MGDFTDDIWADGDDIEQEVTCDRCGAVGLHWWDLPEGWRLFDDNNKLHVCDRQAIARSEFQPDNAIVTRTSKKKWADL